MIIKVHKIFDADGNEIRLEISKFEQTMQNAEKCYLIGKSQFNNGNFDAAIKTYSKWIDILEKLHLRSDLEENEVKSLLIKMYENLCVFYNKVEKPKKTCLMMKELERLTSISQMPRALFAKGKALMMLNEDIKALLCFKAVQKIAPNSKGLNKALEQLNDIQVKKAEYADKIKSNVETFQNSLGAIPKQSSTYNKQPQEVQLAVNYMMGLKEVTLDSQIQKY